MENETPHVCRTRGNWVNADDGFGRAVQYVRYTSPYTYAPNTYYFNPNAGSYYVNPTTTYSGYYAGPTVYGPGYTASYPYMYNQYNYGYYQPYYYPTYTYYRTYRVW